MIVNLKKISRTQQIILLKEILLRVEQLQLHIQIRFEALKNECAVVHDICARGRTYLIQIIVV